MGQEGCEKEDVYLCFSSVGGLCVALHALLDAFKACPRSPL